MSSDQSMVIQDKMHEDQANMQGPSTLPLIPDRNGSSSMLPAPPVMGNVDKTPRRMSISNDAQTPTLDQDSVNLQAASIADLSIGAGSSQPPPTQNPSTRQLLQQQEALWFQRYSTQVQKLEDNSLRQTQQAQKKWLELYLSTSHEITEKSAEIMGLIV